jgi:hypothetical protein
MKNTWRHYFRRIAAACAVSSTMAWSSAVCYAVQLAYDVADDPIYADGWQEGDDGGSGSFGPWRFNGTYTAVTGGGAVQNPADQLAIDDGLGTETQTSNPLNNIGRAWTIHNPKGSASGPSNGPVGTDIARAGRSFAPLQPGQTLSVIFDNPTERVFFRGYAMKLNAGGGNTCAATPFCPAGPLLKYKFERFEYANAGVWWDSNADFDGVDDEGEPPGLPELRDVHTDAGVRIDFMLTSESTYTTTATPLDNPSAALMVSGSLDNLTAGPIDWIQFEFYNTDSDVYPGLRCTPDGAGTACDFGIGEEIRPTDFYIRSLEITGPAPAGVPGDYNNNGTVDAADYVVWRKGGPLQNEVPGVTPGATTAEDYTAWRARFGTHTHTGAGAGSALVSGAVPEPATFIYIAAGATGLALGLGRLPRKDCVEPSA